MGSSCLLLVPMYLALLQLYGHGAATAALHPHEVTFGFSSRPLTSSNFDIQRPYDLHLEERYSFVNGVHKLWVLSSDKPHSRTSRTAPRTEIRIRGYDYSSGVWQFEGHVFVPNRTTGVCIMQVFGAKAPRASTLMLRVYDGHLMYYRRQVIVPDIYDRWFRVNVIHDVGANRLKVFIDGELRLEVNGGGGKSHYFKCGVYGQDHESHLMESHWKGIRVLTKRD